MDKLTRKIMGEMFNFIEKVEICDLSNCGPAIQQEAFELIEKVKAHLYSLIKE